MTLRIAMLGTGSFALPSFAGLLASQHTIVGLVTQPDRTGAGHHQHHNALKEAAQSRGVSVFQPEKASALESLEHLGGWQAELFVVAAYGQILSRKLLAVPGLGAINVHASVLPNYRGASPIQHAIWNGEQVTGISIFQIVPQLDAGPILAMERTPIEPGETSGELEDRLAHLAVPVLLRVVELLASRTAQPQAQDDSQATYARRLVKADGRIDWTRPAECVACQIRAMHPWPKAFSFWQRANGLPMRLIVLQARAVSGAVLAEPGTILATDPQLVVKCGEGALSLELVQPEGKRAMPVSEFLHGHPMLVGQHFVAPAT